MRLSRACYDKPHRCPGWAGGGWRYAATDHCKNGSIRVNDVIPASTVEGIEFEAYQAYPYERPWRFGHCNTCDTVTLPLVTRWLDPTYLAFRVRRVRSDVSQWWHWKGSARVRALVRR